MQPTKKGLPRKHRANTTFTNKWGIQPHVLAEQENLTIDAIHMRVMKWGTPWRRKAMPTSCEIKFGKTMVELAIQYGLHPVYIQQCSVKYGTPYHPNPSHIGTWNKGTTHGDDHWSKNPKFSNVREWLMPQHPDYDLFKQGSHEDRINYLIKEDII